MSITTKEINLQNLNERNIYSLKLQNFEKQFTYPLGKESFYIQHGIDSDYFSFFEKLGTPKVMLLEHNNNIIGLCVAILRNIDNKEVWYLCDFKINKNYQGLGLYRLLFNDFFKPYYSEFEHVFAVNMSEPKDNRLFTYLNLIFKNFCIKIKPNYLYSFKGKDINNFSSEFWKENAIVTNNGSKDIIINNISQSLFHVVNRKHFNQNLKNFLEISIDSLNENDKIMFLSYNEINKQNLDKTIISLIYKENSDFNISSAEI